MLIIDLITYYAVYTYNFIITIITITMTSPF